MTNLKRGFTLIELLVVMAVLGVLITIVIVAINPFEQLAKARDTGRMSSVRQIGDALVNYAASRDSNFPTVAQWNAGTPASNVLVTSGELASVPGAVNYATAGLACATNVTNGTWCYKTSALTGPVIVYARLESKSNNAKCAAGQNAYALFSSADGKAGVVCGAAEPAAPAAAGSFTWL